MKLGYSNLLGEYLQPETIDYNDCKNFQIVCPSCNEPVFKVNRNIEQVDSLHYFSHYNKDKSYNNECELRVDSISKVEFESKNIISRNQKLKYFLKVLQKSIAAKFYNNENVDVTIKKVSRYNSNTSLKVMRNFYFDMVQRNNILKDKNEFYSAADDYISEIVGIDGKFFNTTFSIDTQKRIAFDMWQTIFTPNAKPNFIFLFNHSCIHLITRFGTAMNQRKLYEWEKYLMDRMMILLESNEAEGKHIIRELLDYEIDPPFVIERSSLQFKLLTEVVHEMIGTLLGLPYFELLKENMETPKFELSSNVKTF